MSIWSAIALSLVATCCYQVGTVMQKIGADRLPRIELGTRQSQVVRAFVRSPIWLGGMGIMTAGWVLFLKAIANAPVSIVQPVLGFGLCLLALFSVVFLHERLRPLEWGGVALMVAGVVLLGISGASASNGRASVTMVPLLVVSAAMLALVAGAVRAARAEWGVPLPVVLGFASGVLIGLGALYAKGLFLTLESGSRMLAWLVFLPMMTIANVGGLWIQQAGFQQGRALIVVATNAVTNKIVTIAGGMAIMGELLPAETNLALARIVGFATILLGTTVLARFESKDVESDVVIPARGDDSVQMVDQGNRSV